MDDLVFNTANNIKAEDLINKHDISISLNGDITFENNVTLETIDVVGKVNGIDFNSDIVTIQDKYNGKKYILHQIWSLRFLFTGSLRLTDVKILNNFKLNNKQSETNKTEEEIKPGDFESLFIKNNVTVSFINGQNLTNFINQLCLINISCYIPGSTKINGVSLILLYR